MKTLYIRDDLGHAWAFDGERVYCVAAELEMAETGETQDNGYPCDSWEEAVEILNDGGYITGFDEA